MQAANKHALKSIQKSAEQSAVRWGGKELSIPDGNLVCFKDQEFVVVEQLWEPNVYQLNQLMVSVQSGLWTADNYKTFKKPMMTVITPVMRKWAKYPPPILKSD